MYFARVKNESVWQSLKILFMGSLLIFLINIFFGFDNIFTIGDLPRWQLLIHLHGASIGWITLSAIGVSIWLFTGDREVDSRYEGRIRTLVWAAVVIFACYVTSFGLAFSRPSGFLVALLPIFGVGAVTMLWVGAIYSFSQFSKQPVLTTSHWLIAGALLTAAIGATVGFMLGLERVIGQFLPMEGGDRVGAHAGMMDTYLFLVASCIIEWGLRKEATRWSWAGLLQALLWMIGAALVPIAFFLNMVPQILPAFGLMLILGLIIFLVRYGWRAFTHVPRGKGIRSWIFFGTFWLILYIAFFLYVVATGADFAALPFWYAAAFVHVGFAGMMTNLLMGVVYSRGQDAADVIPWGEAVAFWGINLGIITFIGLKIAFNIRYGALVMGLSILLSVFVAFRRMQKSRAQQQLRVSPS